MRAPQNPLPSPGPNIATAVGGRRLSLLLVEDDRADALLVEELIADAAGEFDFVWSPTVSDAARTLT
ncbi:MAG: fused response regulator/phosphatase, partial [Mycobacterium sp.]